MQRYGHLDKAVCELRKTTLGVRIWKPQGHRRSSISRDIDALERVQKRALRIRTAKTGRLSTLEVGKDEYEHDLIQTFKLIEKVSNECIPKSTPHLGKRSCLDPERKKKTRERKRVSGSRITTKTSGQLPLSTI